LTEARILLERDKRQRKGVSLRKSVENKRRERGGKGLMGENVVEGRKNTT